MKIYLEKDRTQKNYTVADAVKAARIRLTARGINSLCINCIRNKLMTDRITLQELNDLSDYLVVDTLDSPYQEKREVRRGKK
jgi:hypothetical protein